MANKFEKVEVEAISLLHGANPGAFNIMIDYFARQYDLAKTRCVEDNIANVGEHRGEAKAWRDAKDILVDAQKELNS